MGQGSQVVLSTGWCAVGLRPNHVSETLFSHTDISDGDVTINKNALNMS